jgi:hypothetical protein
MSLRSNKGILSSSQHLNSTEITPEGLLSKPKIRKNNTGSYSETAARCRTPGCLDSVSNYNGI